jgi:allantoinase
VDTFDVLYREATTSGRLYLLHLRPWLSGQPFRIGHLERALAHITGRPQVWTASAGEIAEAFALSARAGTTPGFPSPAYQGVTR